MLSSLSVQPTPFANMLHLVACCNADQILIVRLNSSTGAIVRMFSWRIVKGRNMATIADLSVLAPGEYRLTFMDNEGTTLMVVSCTRALDGVKDDLLQFN